MLLLFCLAVVVYCHALKSLRLDVVLTSFQTSFHRSSRPDIVWVLPTCLHVLLLDSVTLPILAKMGLERGNSRQSKKKHQVQKLKSRNHFVPIPAAFAGAPVGIRWLCDSKFMFETLSTDNYPTAASSMAAKMIRTHSKK